MCFSGIYFVVQAAGGVRNLSYEDQGNILVVTTAFGFLNSILNPIIYATKIPSVKRTFLQFFCPCKSRRRERTLDNQACMNYEAHSAMRKGSQIPILT